MEVIEMLVIEIVDKIIEQASPSWMCEFLNVKLNRLTELYSDEGFTDLIELIERAYNTMSEYKLNEMLEMLD
jgi:hypothetical protein